MNRKKLTAALLACAMAVTGLGANTGLVSTANDGGVEFALGDTNGDHKVDATDASEVLAEYSRLSTSGDGYFRGSRKTAADVDGNGKIDSSDASTILRYYAYVSTGGTKELKAFLDGTAPAETTTSTTAASTTTTAKSTTTTKTTTATAPKTTTTAKAPKTTTTTASTVSTTTTTSTVTISEQTTSATTTDTTTTTTETAATTTTSTTTTTETSTTQTTTAETTTTATTTTDPYKVSEIQLSRTEFTMKAGTSELSARVVMLPVTATDVREIWSCSDESIAVVDDQGYVIARYPGKCTITVRSLINPEVKADIELTVTGETTTTSGTTTLSTSTMTSTTETTSAEETSSTTETTTTATGETSTTTTATKDSSRVASIELSVTSVELSVGESGISYVKMLPETAVNKTEIWSSSDPSVASVDIYGNITAKSPGNCTVTVKSYDDPMVSADIAVKVFPAGKVRKIELTTTELTVEIGSRSISYVTMFPKNAPNKDELWVCSDTNIATVDEYGWITGKSVGECIVTVYSVDNPDIKAEIKVTVTSGAGQTEPVVEEPASSIVPGTANDEMIAFCTPFPASANGSFLIEYIVTYADGTQVSSKTSALKVPVLKSYTAYFRKDKGSFSLTSYLIDSETGNRAKIGTYEFTVSPLDCKTTIEDIKYAFYLLGGLSQKS